MYKRNCCKCIKQQIYKENTKHTLLAQKSSHNKAQQAETYISKGLVLHTNIAFLFCGLGNSHWDVK